MQVWICVLSHSVVSNSLQPHGLEPTRLLCPWDSPSKNIGVRCHALLQHLTCEIVIPQPGMGPASPALEALSLNHQGSPTWYIRYPFLPCQLSALSLQPCQLPCPSPNKSPAGQQMRNYLRRGGFCIIMPPSQEDVSPNKQVAATCTIWDPSSSGLFCSSLLERWSSFAPSHTHTHTHTHHSHCVLTPQTSAAMSFLQRGPLTPFDHHI